jgi:BirA family biotin operon repressor/biotin-[acetyl-CoA-carboxylase] ligase
MTFFLNQKLGGVLIENTIQRGRIENSIIGMGLNINQIDFEHPRATSLRRLIGKNFSLEELLPDLLALEKTIFCFATDIMDCLKPVIYKIFFVIRKNTFLLVTAYLFVGMIVGVSDAGLLAVQIENRLEYFDFKEISYGF